MFSRRDPRMNRGRVSGCTIPSLPLVNSGTLAWRVRGNLGYVLNGAGLSAWSDQSGRNKNVSQSTPSKQPVHDQINGRTSVRFDGSADSLGSSAGNTGADWVFMHDGTGVTIFCVLVNRESAGGGAVAETANVGTDIGALLRVSSTTVAFDVTNGVTTVLTISGAISTGVPNYATVRCNDALATDAQIRINGVQVATANKSGAFSVSDATYGVHLGSNNASTASFFDGSIGEVLIYDGDLSDSDILLVEAYIKNYWII